MSEERSIRDPDLYINLFGGPVQGNHAHACLTRRCGCRMHWHDDKKQSASAKTRRSCLTWSCVCEGPHNLPQSLCLPFLDNKDRREEAKKTRVVFCFYILSDVDDDNDKQWPDSNVTIQKVESRLCIIEGYAKRERTPFELKNEKETQRFCQKQTNNTKPFRLE